MNTVELIRRKRNGEALTKEEIEFLITGYTKNKIPDYQMSAFLMAVYFNGMNTEETAALTNAMLYSGKVIDLQSVPGVKIDKHSTGGVGDKTSLIIAPIVAAAGVFVPMISGRGLGHTGGTLDKLESIPGFKTDLNLTQYKSVIKNHGAVLIGQTKDIAPADKKIYALRDVTSTVESIPLITASIMSKKLAEGIDGLVQDVKTGSGAFMQNYEDSKKLAESLINTAKSFNKKIIAMITDMNQPLGNYIGNWLEVYESILVLKGEDVPDLKELSLQLAGAMICLGGKASTIEEGVEIGSELIKNGKAFDKFIDIVSAQGGEITVIKDPSKYQKAKIVEKVYSDKSGYLNSVDCYQLGIISLVLGAGRLTKKDKIDPMAGMIFNFKIGDWINKGDCIAELHTDDQYVVVDGLKNRLLSIIEITEERPDKLKLIKEVIL